MAVQRAWQLGDQSCERFSQDFLRGSAWKLENGKRWRIDDFVGSLAFSNARRRTGMFRQIVLSRKVSFIAFCGTHRFGIATFQVISLLPLFLLSLLRRNVSRFSFSDMFHFVFVVRRIYRECDHEGCDRVRCWDWTQRFAISTWVLRNNASRQKERS